MHLVMACNYDSSVSVGKSVTYEKGLISTIAFLNARVGGKIVPSNRY